MVLEMIKRYITSIIYSVILLGLLGVPLSVAAQQELTREERIKILEQLKMEDKKNRSQHIRINQSEGIYRN